MPERFWVRTPQLMLGYWNNPVATAAVIDTNGWYHTGDAGYLDADGYIYITDRIKDLIVSGGENIYPPEISGYWPSTTRGRPEP